MLRGVLGGVLLGGRLGGGGRWFLHVNRSKPPVLCRPSNHKCVSSAPRSTDSTPQASSTVSCWGGALARRASVFDHSPPVPVAPTSPNNLEYLRGVSKNLAHPLHPVYDDGKGGGWKWWE